MKNKPIALLLMALLLTVSSSGLFSCRTIKKDRSHADSTAARIEQKAARWESESVQEIIIEAGDVADLEPGLSLPAILGLTISGPADFIGSMDSFQDDTIETKRPARRKKPAKITIRSSTRSAGETSSSRTEFKQASTSARVIAKQPNPWRWESIILVIVGVLTIAAILTRTKRS